MLFKRTISGALLAAFVISIIALSHSTLLSVLMPLVLAGICVMGILEFYNLMEQKGVKTLKAFAAFASVIYIMTLYWSACIVKSPVFQIDAFALFFIFIGFFLVYFLDIYSKKDNSALLDISVSFMGFFYIVWLLGFILKINYFPDIDGRKYLFLLIVTTKVTDMSAYFTGKKFGKIKLCPRISPNKTVEGALGGFAGSVLSATLFTHFFIDEMSMKYALIIGTVMGIAGQLGDLAESLLKRDAGVKDSSKRFPGLGGVLDVLDSIFFTAPVMYFFMKFIF